MNLQPREIIAVLPLREYQDLTATHIFSCKSASGESKLIRLCEEMPRREVNEFLAQEPPQSIGPIGADF
ncbi:hypothetical protein [uncultured Xylophilus sp.]|uniref:hypothetical protein n=1 Tax=uncultured Xylophilus sp. TaxID=296832 RepID=UPI0025DDF588|nr:hypothetical protein [uncultured Xylophilus sp.]